MIPRAPPGLPRTTQGGVLEFRALERPCASSSGHIQPQGRRRGKVTSGGSRPTTESGSGPTDRLLHRRTETKASGMAKCHRQRVRDVEGRVGRPRAEKPQDHGPHLPLLRSAVPGHRLLHRGRRVLRYRDALPRQDGQEHSSRLCQLKRRAGIDAVKRSLDRRARGSQSMHQILERHVEGEESVRKSGRGLQADDVATHELRTRGRSGDEPPSRPERSWIDAEDAHGWFFFDLPRAGARGLRQEASVSRSAASTSRFA